MQVTETKTNGVLILGLNGRLDARTAPGVQERLMGILAGPDKQVAINCAALDYVSSAGLRVLLLATRDLRLRGGRLVLYSLSDYLKDLFEMAGLSAVLLLFASEAEALGSFKG